MNKLARDLQKIGNTNHLDSLSNSLPLPSEQLNYATVLLFSFIKSLRGNETISVTNVNDSLLPDLIATAYNLSTHHSNIGCSLKWTSLLVVEGEN